MPNPKTGTVTTDVAKAIQEIKAGKSSSAPTRLGWCIRRGEDSFTPEKLVNNATTLITERDQGEAAGGER